MTKLEEVAQAISAELARQPNGYSTLTGFDCFSLARAAIKVMRVRNPITLAQAAWNQRIDAILAEPDPSRVPVEQEGA